MTELEITRTYKIGDGKVKTIPLRDVKRGEFLKRRTDSIKIYRRGEYDREYG